MGPDAAATGAPSTPPNVAALEDVDACYRCFLGRDREDAGRADSRVGQDIASLLRGFVSSPEFEQLVVAPAMAGGAPVGPAFATAPPPELRRWAAKRLPLTASGAAKVADARSWQDLHGAIFSDPSFTELVVEPDSVLARLGSRLSLPREAALEDISFCYQCFLGRYSELEGDDGRVGHPLHVLVYGFVVSAEFETKIATPLLEGQELQGPVFAEPPSEALRRWAARRLPLTLKASQRALDATSWYQFHTALFADPYFVDQVQGPLAPRSVLARIGIAPPPFADALEIVGKSLLFERDWYLATYQEVARSGGDPLHHYLRHGVAESCNPNRLFDTRWYLASYPEVEAGLINPLVHYILHGAERGCSPHPFFPADRFPANHPVAVELGLTPLAAFLRRPSAFDAPMPRFALYDAYRATEEVRYERAREGFRAHIAAMTFLPRFVVLVEGGSPEALARTRASVMRQIYPHVVMAASVDDALRARAEEPGATWLLWPDAGDELHQDALYELASALNADPELDLLYFDHETARADGLAEPAHKPEWSPDYLEAVNYIGTAACFRWTVARGLLPQAAGCYDLLLRFTEGRRSIQRVARVLLRCPPVGPSLRQRQAMEVRALEGRLARTRRTGRVRPLPADSLCYSVDVSLRAKPLVSIVIPTAARVIDYESRRIDLIKSCLESIDRKSTYRNVEFVIVDNGDFDRKRLDSLGIRRIRFVTYDSPQVNIARKINLGARHAEGDYLLLMNDDIEVISPDWIERLLAHLEKPHVGVVGAKLLYPNMSIQHAGIVMCAGDWEHVRRGRPRDDVGHAFSTSAVHNYLAVTGAVSMVRARDFADVDGYSEEFPIDYNDIDFSLKLREAGFSVVYEPRAELIHYESVSAVRPPGVQDSERFRGRWVSLPLDPYYDEARFSHHPATFELAYSERRL